MKDLTPVRDGNVFETFRSHALPWSWFRPVVSQSLTETWVDILDSAVPWNTMYTIITCMRTAHSKKCKIIIDLYVLEFMNIDISLYLQLLNNM